MLQAQHCRVREESDSDIHDYHCQIGSSTVSDMVSVTAGLDHDAIMALMTPLPDQCTPDSE